MKLLDEIEAEYADAFDVETKLFKDKLRLAKNLDEKKIFEKKYSIKFKKILSKYEKAVRKFAKKNPKLLLSDVVKKKKKPGKKFKPYSVKSINLKQNWFVQTKIKIMYFLFKIKLIFKKFFRLIVPLSIHYVFYRMEFFLRTVWDDLVRKFIKFKSNLIKLIINFTKQMTSFFIGVWKKLMSFWHKLLPVKEKKQEKDILAENRERIKAKS